MQTTLDDQIVALDTVWVDVDNVNPAPRNDRTHFDKVALWDLAESMREHGLLQPIVVRPIPPSQKVFWLVAGERRWRAAQLLGWEQIPAIVHWQMTDEQASLATLEENIKRADIDFIDEAEGYRYRMDAFGYDVKTMAAKAGVTVDRVRERLRLLDLVPEAQQQVRKGRMKLGHAALMSDLDRNHQYQALALFVRGRTPSIGQFREFCGKLLEQQSQAHVDDLLQVWQEQLASPSEPNVETGFVCDPSLPMLTGADTNVYAALKHYVAQLHNSGRDSDAAAVSTLAHHLVRGRWVKRPN
jgi:ParB/RepB/Spo0J family partition protein